MGNLTVRTYGRPEDVPGAEWDSLTARSPASLAGSRAWVEAALATVDHLCVPALVAVHAAGRVVGLLTLVVDESDTQPVLRFAASPSNDLADLMTLPGYEFAAGSAVIAALGRFSRLGFAVRLEDLDPAGALANADSGRCLLRWKAGAVAPTIDLRDVAATPSRRQHRRWDRSLRQLRSTRRVEFRRREGPMVIDALDGFTRQRDTRLRALGRNLCTPPPELLEAAVRRLAGLGRCVFMEMLVDETIVSRDLYLVDGAVAMLWLRALDMGWLRYSCGHLLLRASAERFADEGYETLDLGRGGEPYKFGFGARERVLLTASLRAAGDGRSQRIG